MCRAWNSGGHPIAGRSNPVLGSVSMNRPADNFDGNLRLSIEECDRLRTERGLSSRQVDVLRCLFELGLSDKAICKALNMRRGTLCHHMASLRATFRAASRLQVVERVLAFLRGPDGRPSGDRQEVEDRSTAGLESGPPASRATRRPKGEWTSTSRQQMPLLVGPESPEPPPETRLCLKRGLSE